MMDIKSSLKVEAILSKSEETDITGIGQLVIEIHEETKLAAFIKADILPRGFDGGTGKLAKLREDVWTLSDKFTEDTVGIACITEISENEKIISDYLAVNLHSLVVSLSPVDIVAIPEVLANNLNIPIEQIELYSIAEGIIILKRW